MCIWLVKDSGITICLTNPHQYNPILLSLPNTCCLSSTIQIYNLFSLILSNSIPRCLFLLAVKSYWIRIKHTVTVERNLLTGGYIDWKILLKSKFLAITSRTDRTKSELGSWEFSFDPVSYGRFKERQLWNEAWTEVTSLLMFHVRPSVPYHRSFLVACGRHVWSSSLLLKRKL